MGEKQWAVFIVNPNDANDRLMLTSPLDSESQADHFRQEFERINALRDEQNVPSYRETPERIIRFED